MRRDEGAVLPLVQEGAGLLPGPGGGEVAHTVLRYLHGLRDRTERQDDLERQPLVAPHARVVPQQDALGSERMPNPGNHIVAHPLESRR